MKFRIMQEGKVQVISDDGKLTGIFVSKAGQGGCLIEGKGRRMKASDRESAKQAASDILQNIVGTPPKDDVAPAYATSADAWVPRGVPYGPYS